MMKVKAMALMLLGTVGCQGEQGSDLFYDEVPASHSDTGVLGQAYSKLNKRLINLSCVSGDWEVRGNEIGDLNYAKDMSFERVNDVINGELGVAIKFPAVSAGASAKIAMAQSVDELSETHTFYWAGINRKKVLLGDSLRVSSKGEEIINAYPNRIQELCGDEFVSEVQYGAILMATMRIDFLNKEDKNSYGGALNIGLKGGIVKVDGELEKVDEDVKKRVRVSIHARQMGGDATGLLSILSENIVTCDLDDLNPCLDTIRNLVAYGKGEFREALSQPGEMENWNVLKYVTQRYDESGLFELTPDNAVDSLPLSLIRLRQNLERSYLEELSNKERAERLKAYGNGLVDEEVKQGLEDLIEKASINIQAYTAIQEFCYRKPLQCAAEWNMIEAELEVYDSSILEIKIEVPEEEYKVKSYSAKGGNGGSAFTTLPFLSGLEEARKIKKIAIRSGKRIDQISVEYRNGYSLKRGGNGGGYREINLRANEYVTRLEVHVGHKGSNRIFYIKIDTNLRKGALQGGRRTSTVHSWVAPEGMKIAGFHGRSGAELDRLGPIMTSI